MSTETTNKKIKIDNGTTFGKTYTDKAVDERLQGLVSTATFTPVKEKANNSLQKPAGLTKTKLVGVGTNGQENIEIGDNLKLDGSKLSATGGGVNGLQSDAEGNLTVGKNLGVDGKLTLKSLVMYGNPDGDITKAQMHMYSIFITDNCYFDVCTSWNNRDWSSGSMYATKDILTNTYYKELHKMSIYSASGYYHGGTTDSPINLIVSQFRIGYNHYEISGYDLSDSTYKTFDIQISNTVGAIKRF